MFYFVASGLVVGEGMVRRRPMRPLGPTTKGSERAFQFLSASGGS